MSICCCHTRIFNHVKFLLPTFYCLAACIALLRYQKFWTTWKQLKTTSKLCLAFTSSSTTQNFLIYFCLYPNESACSWIDLRFLINWLNYMLCWNVFSGGNLLQRDNPAVIDLFFAIYFLQALQNYPTPTRFPPYSGDFAEHGDHIRFVN